MATIYGIECTRTGKIYVGCTTAKLAKRMREHRCLLRANKHNEPDFQADWNLYSGATFSLRALQDIGDATIAQKRAAELHWMQHFSDVGRLYNRNRMSFQPTPETVAKGQPRATAVEGKKRSPEANLKRRLAQLGIPKGHGAKISATKRAKQMMR